MKRLLTYGVVICVLIMTMMQTIAFAADEKMVFSTSDAEGIVGGEVTVNIDISNNTGFAAYTIDMQYDTDYLAIKSAEMGTIGGGYDNGTLVPNLSYKADTARFVYAAESNIVGDGTILAVTFDVTACPTEGCTTPVTITLDFLGSENWEEENIADTAECTGSEVTIKQLDSIAVSGDYKTDYVEGQELDITGLVVTATYNTSETAQISVDKCVISGNSSPLAVGDSVVVSYTENGITKEAALNITVVEKRIISISVDYSNAKTEYIEDEMFSADGIKVFAQYNDETEVELSAGEYTLSGAEDTLAVSDKAVTVIYANDSAMTAEIPIAVSAKKLLSITVAQKPSKLIYKKGESFDETGMQVKGTYNNGKEYDLNGYTVSGFDSESWGDKNVVISMDGINSEAFLCRCIIAGDVTYNGSIQANDAVAILQIISGRELDDYRQQAADVVGSTDGIDPSDAVAVLRRCAGLSVTFKW